MALAGRQFILEMQLFHELKQRFPNIPDRIVTHTIKQTGGNRAACTCLLEAERLWSSVRMPGGPGRPGAVVLEVGSGEESRSAPPSPWLGWPERRPSNPHPLHPRHQSPPEKPRRLPAVRSTSMPDVKPLSLSTHLLIQEQLARKKKLELELAEDKNKLRAMQETLRNLEADLQARLQAAPILSERAERLKKEINQLRADCGNLASQVDLMSVDSSMMLVPLGETSEEFYQNIYTGQQLQRRIKPTPRNKDENSEERSGGQWCCHMCTFRNHPLLDKCEACDMARIISPLPMAPPAIDDDAPNIHIRVTHHNYPSYHRRKRKMFYLQVR